MDRKARLSAFLFLPYLVITISISIYVYHLEKLSRVERIETEQSSDVNLAANSILNQIRFLKEEITILSKSIELQKVIQQETPTSIKELQKSVLNLVNVRKSYHQIRWIDETGMEKLRVENLGYRSAIVPARELQDKSQRYYFKDTMSLKQGEVFFSRFDLNVEHGKIETPYRPMLRVAEKVFDEKTKRNRGIVIINFSGQKILDIFTRQFSSAHPEFGMLVDGEGYWLKNSVPSSEWGFMFNKPVGFSFQYPKEWKKIKKNELGNIENSKGLFTYQKILVGNLNSAKSTRTLYSISFVPEQQIVEKLSSFKTQIVTVTIALIILGLLLSFAISNMVIKRNQLKKKQEQVKARTTLLNSLGEGIIGVDQNGKCNFINQTALDCLGYKAEDILFKSLHDTLHYAKPSGETYSEKDCPISHAIFQHHTVAIEDYLITSDRSFLPVKITNKPLNTNDSEKGSIITFRDISDIVRAKNKVFELSNFDTLTKLPNREMFLKELNGHTRAFIKSGKSALLIVIDISRFSNFNDSLGDSYGNLLLICVAERLSKFIRNHDIASRVGSDEFAILLQNISLDKSIFWIESVLKELTQPYDLFNSTYNAAFAVGCCLVPHDGASGDEALHNAQIALSKAKTNKLENISYFSSEMREVALRKNSLEQALKHALSANEFSLYYQPQIDTVSSQLLGAEALIRWKKDNEIISPSEFIPLAEDTGLINLIDRFVINSAIKQRAKWYKTCPDNPFVLSINVSAKQFASEDFTFMVASALKHHQLPSNLIGLEITESSMISDPDKTVETLNALKKIGVKLSIDDFGTGYSSLNYLKQLPFDTLKIDQSFIRGVENDTKNLSIIESMLSLSKAFSMQTIAEGVETESEFRIISSLGCDSIQGYYFSKPLPLRDFEKWIEKLPINPK